MPLHAVPTSSLVASSTSSTLPPQTSVPTNPGGPGLDPGEELQQWSSLIGIVTAIVGNILIALALNVQRYAHIRLHRQRSYARERAKTAMKRAQDGNTAASGYGTATTNGNGTVGESSYRNGAASGDGAEEEAEPLSQSFQSGGSGTSDSDDCAGGGTVTSTYLKSPYWWLGQVLITVGEIGNFLAYGFAPASIVSPLGVVALIANCMIAPALFKEKFRARDFWGVVVAVLGVVTVVLSAKQEEVKLEPHDVWDAITTLEFEIYMAVSVCLIIILMWASPRYGNRTILIDLGLVGLFGGYTALATKGVSSMLSSTLFGAFTQPVTYYLILVLLGTAVMQVRYVNKALQRFSSTQVIPIQFVLFTLCVITGSAVLYRDFERTTAVQALQFIGGCLFTFFGVFLITSGRDDDEDEETLSEVEGVEETIGLAEQGGASPRRTPRGSVSSRRSSRAARVSFVDAIIKPLNLQHDYRFPSGRTPTATAKSPIESTPLLRESLEADNPTGHRHSISVDSAAAASISVASPPASEGGRSPTLQPSPGLFGPDRPVTPRMPPSSSRPHSHHFHDLMISPSPLSSTVSAVMKDTLRRTAESPLLPRSSLRKIRSSIRASLYMPDDDNGDEPEEEDRAGHSRLREVTTNESIPETNASSDSARKNGVRSRARSLSDTLGEFFGVKRKSKSRSPADGATATETDAEDASDVDDHRPGLAQA